MKSTLGFCEGHPKQICICFTGSIGSSILSGVVLLNPSSDPHVVKQVGLVCMLKEDDKGLFLLLV